MEISSSQLSQSFQSLDDHQIDESLYSRQLYVMGHEAQKKMAKSDVLLLGMNGVGVEIAKNIILSGVKSLTIYDDTLTTMFDLSSQFYLSENEIGQSRGRSTISKLIELNPYVHVGLLEGELCVEQLLQFSVVVAVNTPFEQQLNISNFCHQNRICYVATDVFGVFGNVFCDFGKDFVVNDTTGENAESSIVASITALDLTTAGI
jgi:ubiquitin-activating enzyme E1